MKPLFKFLVLFVAFVAIFLLILTLVGGRLDFDALFYVFIGFILICLLYSVSVIIGKRNGQNQKISIILFILSLIFICYFSMFYASCAGCGPPVHDAQIKAGMDQMRQVAETYRLNNKSYIGFENTENGIKLKQDINSKSGKPLIIFSSKDKYCIQQELYYREKTSWFKEVSTYFCVDFTGYIGSFGGCDAINYDCAN